MLTCLTHSTETLLHASFNKYLKCLPQCCVNLPGIKHGIKYLYFLRNCMGDRNSGIVTMLVGTLLHWQISDHRHKDRQINNWQSTLWLFPLQKLSPSTHFAMMTHTHTHTNSHCLSITHPTLLRFVIKLSALSVWGVQLCCVMLIAAPQMLVNPDNLLPVDQRPSVTRLSYCN